MTLVFRALLMSLVAASSARAQQHVAPSDAPARVTIAETLEPGPRLTVSGRVLGSDGRPIAGASIYAYQTDANGEYVKGMSGGGSDRPRLFGYLRSDVQGRYSFSTIRPGSYPNSRNPGHIHFEISAPGRETRIYEIVFENDPYISAAFREQAKIPYSGVEIVTARTAANGTLEVTHDIRVK